MKVHRVTLAILAWPLASLPVAAQTPASRPTAPVSTCVTLECHGEVLSSRVLHAPAARNKCDACHELTDPPGHRFSLTAPQSQLCSLCHVQTYRTFVHEPVADGECTGCHDPHGSEHRYLLVQDAAGGLCFECHPAEEFESKKYVHGPVAAGACVVCHEAHSSWNPKLLARSGQDLCQLCHADVLAGLELSRHPHQPVLQGRCLECHQPHASDYPAQLQESLPQLCFRCHEHDRVRKLVETSDHVHGAIKTEASCTACHTGHGGPLPKLLAMPLMTLCLSCHAESMETADGRRITDMATLLRDNPYHHGPVRRADCSACHDPHASPNFGLLIKRYPKMFYAPFDLKHYELCFTCHRKEIVTARDGTGVTGFRAGQLNLHYVHVNKKEKGRTCRACHEVHASRRPFHIRESVPFGSGGWEIEINFVALPDGGSCAPGCHQEQTYKQGSVPASRTAETRAREGEDK